jgi:hypothetical protein
MTNSSSVNRTDALINYTADDDCRILLESDGSLINNFTLWKPHNCTTYSYSQSESLECFDKRKRKGRINHITIFGDSFGRFLGQTINQHFNLSSAAIPDTKIWEYVTKESEYLRVEYIPVRFLYPKDMEIVYARKPEFTFVTFGRWYVRDYWTQNILSSRNKFEERMILFKIVMHDWAHMTDRFLIENNSSKVCVTAENIRA